MKNLGAINREGAKVGRAYARGPCLANMLTYDLVSKAKIELHLFQKYFIPHTPQTVQTSTAAHASYAQSLSVNVSIRAEQCQIS